MTSQTSILDSASTLVEELRKATLELRARDLYGNLTGASMGGFDQNRLDHMLASSYWIVAMASELVQMGQQGYSVLEAAAEAFELVSNHAADFRGIDKSSAIDASAFAYAVQTKLPSSRLLMNQHAAAAGTNAISSVTTREDFKHYLETALHLSLSGLLPQMAVASQMDSETSSKLYTIIKENPELAPLIASGIRIGQALLGAAGIADGINPPAIESVYQQFEEAQRLARFDPEILDIIRMIAVAIGRILPSFAAIILRENTDLPPEYISLLPTGPSPVPVLWPPQIEAIESGLCTAQHVALSLPTGSGKTLLAEMRIVSALGLPPQGLVFYVVPLNALARQVQRDLQARLRLAPLRYNIKVLTGTYEIDDSELSGQEENIIITTPEKLDGLLRNLDNEVIKSQFDRCKLFIFDECHLIKEGKRGIIYEFLIARLRSTFPSAQTMSMSAVFGNLSEFQSWLTGDPSAPVVTSSWRPTSIHYGTWDREGMIVFDNTWKFTGYERSDKLAPSVAKLSIDLQRTYGSILVISESRIRCESYCREIEQAIIEANVVIGGSEELHRLSVVADRIDEEFGHPTKLSHWVRTGIAYHHGYLPANVKAMIEDLTAAGALKFVVSTTTLSERVTFPIRCVIVANIMVGSSAFDPLKLRNIFGRAGRAHVSTGGLAITLRGQNRVQFNGHYMFPEAHAVAFGVTAYQLAWLKCYYPLEFMTGLFNQQPMGFWGLETLKEDGKRHGIAILNPDVNKSMEKCAIEDSSIRLGFLNVANLGEAAAKAIVEERGAHGPFTSLGKLMERTGLKREVVERLVDAGAFDYLEQDRRSLLWEVGLRYRPASKQLALALPVGQDMVELRSLSEWERMAREYSTLDLYPNGHLMEKFRPHLGKGVITSEELGGMKDGKRVKVAGLVARPLQHPLANAYFITLQDEYGLIPLIIWTSVYEEYRSVLREPLLVVEGILSRREGTITSSGPHHQDSGEAKIRESTAGVSRNPSSDCKACGCSSKHLCGLTAWNT